MKLKVAREPGTSNAKVGVPLESWSVRYRAVFDDGAVKEWKEYFGWLTDDKEKAAGNLLLARKYGTTPQIVDGKLYPPHRLREVTWTVL